MAAIPIPISRTKIATQPWGIPITNEVNRLTTQEADHESRLDALEPKVATSAWVAMSLQNGWQNFDTVNYDTLSYRKIGDVVQFRGVIKLGATASTVATFPAGYRPLHTFSYIVSCGGFPNPAVLPSCSVSGQTGALIIYDTNPNPNFVHLGFYQFSTI